MLEMILLSLMGGMGLFLYGMHLMSESLQKIAGQKLRTTMSTLTNNRFIGLFTGAVITIIFQSSSATTVILVSLTSAAIISLRQTLAVILGADIGTTVTAQLIALRVTEIALPIVGIGAAIVFFCKRDYYKRFGQAIVGFGLLFLGLKIIADTMYPLRENQLFITVLVSLADYPLLLLLLAIIFTSLVQSSTATVGIVMLLAIKGMIPVSAAMYLLFGANIGTASTAILASLNAGREAQQVAMAHFLFKLTGVILFWPFASLLVELVTWLTPHSPGFQVANMHAIFNITIALLFLPFIVWFEKLLKLILPDQETENGEIKPKHLDAALISAPAIAIGMAMKEISRISDSVAMMLAQCDSILKKYDAQTIAAILEKEDKVNKLAQATNQYLTLIMRQSISRDEFNHCMSLINISKDYEHIGDVIDKNIVYLVESKYAKDIHFSQEGQLQLEAMVQKITEMLQLVNTAFVTNSCYLAEKAKAMQTEIEDLEFRIRMSHFTRLKEDVDRPGNTTPVYLDMINAYLRIGEHLKNIATALTDEISCTWHAELELIYGPDDTTNKISKK